MGVCIKEKREALKMTQEQLAKMSGVSRVAISMIENGKIENVSSKTLLALADALGTSLDEMFDR